jgi:hypothetical protein
MKFYPRTITETPRARSKGNSLAATLPGVRKDGLSRDVIIIIIVPPFASRDLVFATNQGAVVPIRERSLPPNQTLPRDLTLSSARVRPTGQHPSFQKLEASTPVHLTLDNFESVDLALDRSVVPGRFDRQLHRTKIAAQGSGELRQKRKPRAGHRRNRLRRPARAPPAQHRTKLQGKFSHSIGAGQKRRKLSRYLCCTADMRRDGFSSRAAIRPAEK